jgi:hypothetical protein
MRVIHQRYCLIPLFSHPNNLHCNFTQCAIPLQWNLKVTDQAVPFSTQICVVLFYICELVLNMYQLVAVVFAILYLDSFSRIGQLCRSKLGTVTNT